MKIKFSRSYKKINKAGVLQTVFVYKVSGSDEQLETFEKAMGDNYRESEEGEALWFTTRFVGSSGDLLTTSSGNVAADMSRFDQAASLASQYGGNLGQELAKHAAATLMGNAVSNTVSAPVKSVEATEKL